MIVAKKLLQENIAEYLLYMWQVEDILRAAQLDVERLQSSYLSRFNLDGAEAEQLRKWYENLAEMMRSEGVEKQGHLQINKNVIIWLSDVHSQLLHSTKHPYYSAAYYKALPFIVELRSRSNSTEKSEIENCFDALYGLMMLRLQGKPVSVETQTAFDAISKFIAMLADYYKKDKNGEVEY